MRAREVPAAAAAAAGARLGAGKEWGREGGSGQAPAINAPCGQVSGPSVTAAMAGSDALLLRDGSKIVRLGPSHQHRARGAGF